MYFFFYRIEVFYIITVFIRVSVTHPIKKDERKMELSGNRDGLYCRGIFQRRFRMNYNFIPPHSFIRQIDNKINKNKIIKNICEKTNIYNYSDIHCIFA